MLLSLEIGKIFNKIGTTDKFCVEFGLHDGISDNTTRLIHWDNWQGVLNK